MKLNCKNVIFIVFVSTILIFGFSNISLAGNQYLNSLDFQIDIQENGDIHITETWNVDLEDTNTLFKTFSEDDRYDGITNVSVSEIENSKEIPFEQANEYNYHVDENYYHALENPDGDFEIAWGVNSSYDRGREFKISYTVLNHVSVYNDCAEIYWQLIGSDFQIHCEEVTGTINLPDGITDIEDFRVWAHGPLNGTIYRESEKLAKFNVSGLDRETLIEIRLAMPTSIFPLSNKKINTNNLQAIIDEEMVLAEEANTKREMQAKTNKIISIGISVLWVCGIILGLIHLNKYTKKLAQERKIKPEVEYEYFREIPDDDATPAEACFIYYSGEAGVASRIERVVSATLLNLSLKGWLEFNTKIVGKKQKEEIEVTLKDNGKEPLKQDEEEIYKYLIELFEEDETKTFTMKEFKEKATDDITKFYKLNEKLAEITRKENVKKGIFDETLKTKGNKFALIILIYVIILFVLFMAMVYNCSEGEVPEHNIVLGIVLAIISVINIVIGAIGTVRHNGFTQKGVNEMYKWLALAKYMKDFSLLNEKAVPYLVLWEKYLVYATVFDIAEKVIEQLRVQFPEMSDEDYLRTHCAYMYFVSTSKSSFIGSINSSISSVINYSSGGGAGGGFSGGGGGAGGGGGGGR